MKKRNLLALTAALALSSSAAFAASSAQDAAAEAASAAPVAVKFAPTQSYAQRTTASKDEKTKETAVTPSYIEAPEEFEIASLGRRQCKTIGFSKGIRCAFCPSASRKT